MATPKVNKYTLGRGEVHLAPFKTGTQTPDGFRYVGNTPTFGYTMTTQELDHFSSDHGVGELDMSIATQVTRAGAFATDNVDLDNTALTFFGAKATITSTSATGTSETLNSVKQDASYQLGVSNAKPAGVRKITNVVVAVASSAKTAGTDYVVDTDRGFIYIMPGGGIAANANVTVTYDQVASSYDQVISGNTPFEGALMFIADNPAGPNVDYLCPWVRVTPNGEYSLKAENALQQLQYNLKILKANNRSAVYANGQPYTG